MPAFRPSRFAQVHALKGIDLDRLVRFLNPYSDYLGRRGCQPLPDAAALDYENLSLALMSPDEDVPRDMVDALFFVHELASDQGMEQLISEARSRGLDLDLGDEPTPADTAVAAWLVCPEMVEDLHAESAVLRPRNFEYYKGTAQRQRDFPGYDKTVLSEIASHLDVWFVEHKRGRDDCKVLVVPHGPKVYLLVRHGNSMRREPTTTRGESGIAYFRPEIHDVLVYDGSADVLGLKAGTKGEKTLYRQVFGEMLFGHRDYFDAPFCFSLDPLLEDGPAVTACEDVPGLSEIRLVEVRRWRGGRYKSRDILQATDLFKDWGSDWERRLNAGRLVSVTFEVAFEGDGRKRRKVTIAHQSFAKYERDEDADLIETWLKLRGIMPQLEPGIELDADAAIVLDGAGGPPLPGDRPEGLAGHIG